MSLHDDSVKNPPGGEPPQKRRSVAGHLHWQRDILRRTPGFSHAYRSFIFAAGLFFIGIGIGLAALPGPLTIPPILLGVWIWSSEFAWADRFLDSVKAKFDNGWKQAKRRPVSSAVFTIVGLAGAGCALWAVSHFELLGRAAGLLPF